jgi:hypothetical protein
VIACGKAGRTSACVRVIVLLPRNVTLPSTMEIAPPYPPCARRWSGAGPPQHAAEGPTGARGRRATRRCARVGDRHAVEHELALLHEDRPARCLHARGCRAFSLWSHSHGHNHGCDAIPESAQRACAHASVRMCGLVLQPSVRVCAHKASREATQANRETEQNNTFASADHTAPPRGRRRDTAEPCTNGSVT